MSTETCENLDLEVKRLRAEKAMLIGALEALLAMHDDWESWDIAEAVRMQIAFAKSE